MTAERIVLFFSWILTGTLIWILVPKSKIREAHVIFLFKQVLTWMFGHIVVQLKLIEYPVHLFEVVLEHSTNLIEYINWT